MFKLEYMGCMRQIISYDDFDVQLLALKASMTKYYCCSCQLSDARCTIFDGATVAIRRIDDYKLEKLRLQAVQMLFKLPSTTCMLLSLPDSRRVCELHASRDMLLETAASMRRAHDWHDRSVVSHPDTLTGCEAACALRRFPISPALFRSIISLSLSRFFSLSLSLYIYIYVYAYTYFHIQ